MAIKKRPGKPVVTHATRQAVFDGFDERAIKKPVQSIAKPVKVSVDLEQLFAKAIANDADEIVVRIAQYDQNLDPANYQAIVRFSDRTRAWASAVHEKPHIAFVDALMKAGEMPGPTMKERVNVKTSDDTARVLRGGAERTIKRPPVRLRKGT